MFSDEMVELFGEFLDENDRKGLRHDMASVEPAEAARFFGRAGQVLAGHLIAAEPFDPCLYTVLADAMRRAGEACHIAEGYSSEGFTIDVGHDRPIYTDGPPSAK